MRSVVLYYVACLFFLPFAVAGIASAACLVGAWCGWAQVSAGCLLLLLGLAMVGVYLGSLLALVVLMALACCTVSRERFDAWTAGIGVDAREVWLMRPHSAVGRFFHSKMRSG